VRPADRQLSGPVVAGEPKFRARRGRGHCQEQDVVVFATFIRRGRHGGRGRGFCRLRGHHHPRRPCCVHRGHHRARRQLAPDRRSTAAATAATVHQTVSRSTVLITI